MIKPYFQSDDKRFILYHGDSLEILGELTKCSIDMIFADPPYFLSNDGITCRSGKQTSVNKGKWDKSKGVKENHKFNKSWIRKCRGILKDNGTIWISGTFHNVYSVGFALQELNFKILNNITWEKSNPPPNLGCRCFTHSTETILWAKPDKAKHYFNYKEMKVINNNKQMKDVWRSSTTPKREKSNGKHPTQKPLALLDRIIVSSTDIDDLVLDPFSGSGTTMVSAVKLNRRYIGIEKEKEYLDLSIRRFLSEIKNGIK